MNAPNNAKPSAIHTFLAAQALAKQCTVLADNLLEDLLIKRRKTRKQIAVVLTRLDDLSRELDSFREAPRRGGKGDNAPRVEAPAPKTLNP